MRRWGFDQNLIGQSDEIKQVLPAGERALLVPVGPEVLGDRQALDRVSDLVVDPETEHVRDQ